MNSPPRPTRLLAIAPNTAARSVVSRMGAGSDVVFAADVESAMQLLDAGVFDVVVCFASVVPRRAAMWLASAVADRCPGVHTLLLGDVWSGQLGNALASARVEAQPSAPD